ncbi:helix-turn-helix transcriptional regulator [Bhargavaea cecembensis]|uniref:helix-turn-helix transcriptional regulator n=1 Tax=Bhargavaea cecembensis TaxID=394098 RepID=UPI0015CF5279|nr:response regulator transcription factor [Bhargavaea cecembensis]
MTRILLDEFEVMRAYDRSEDFYRLEKELLTCIAEGDKQGAKDRLCRIVQMISEIAGEERTVQDVSYYFIILSALVARILLKPKFTVERTVAFNITCMRIVERKFGTSEISELSNDMVEFFIHVLQGRKKPELAHPVVNEVIEYIDAAIESNLTVASLAGHFNISTSHLSRIFREHTGLTLIDYINMRKIEESQYFLRNTDLKISAVAEQFSFCNQSYFTRTFKKYTELTPKQFREQKEIEYFSFSLPAESD